jgi:predicted Zn finger-like uncharacterized protein
MKFVCDNCQAKYQIGDDKVAGKTVRMKCRKCGYNIKVSPMPGTEHAASGDVPSMHDAPVSLAPASLQTHAVAPTPAPVAAAPAPPAEQGRSWDDESTSLMTMPMHLAAATSPASAPRAPAPSPHRPVTPAPRPAAPAPRPVAPVTGERPRSITASGTPRPQPTPAPAALRQTGTHPAVRPVSRTTTGQMAAVKVEPEHEWYVGIAGTPIGPVRVSVIRERAANREVDGDSLVWREGLPEWRPLKTFPELLEVVHQALRKSAPPPPPVHAVEAPSPPPAPTPTPLAAVAAMAASAPAAPVALAPKAVVSAPIAPTPAPAVAPLVAEPPPGAPAAKAANGKANGVHVEALGAAPAPAPVAQAPTAAIPMGAVPSPGSGLISEAPKPPLVARPKDDDASLEESLIPRRRGGVHPMAYAFVAAAAVFGGVAAWVLLRPQQPQIVVVQAPAPVTPDRAPNAAPPPPPKDDDKGQVDVGEPSTANSGARQALGPRPKTSASAASSGVAAAPLDTSSFVPNVPGPAATAPPQGNAGGGQLSQGEIQAVVAQNQAMIKRKCWMPALEAKPPNAPSSAKVVGSMTIGASGNVESANASGGDAFPGLASCIADRMRHWKFPPSGSSTPVSVPFVFAGQ